MQFRYLPDGAPETSAMLWDFAPAKMTNAEAERIEELTGWSITQWEDKVYLSSMKALHALLYVMLRRTRPHLRYKEVEFTLSEVGMVFSDEELEQMQERAERLAEGLDPYAEDEPADEPADPADDGAAADPFGGPAGQGAPEGVAGP